MTTTAPIEEQRPATAAEDPTELRKHPRFVMNQDAVVMAFVRILSDDESDELEPREHPAEVMDLSKQGAKLGLPEPLPIKGEIEIRIVCESLNLEFRQKGSVCWARPMAKRQWWIGCGFDEPVSDKHIQQLASTGYLERRQDQREEISIAASIQWECNPTPESISILDLSPGGFCATAQRMPENGERVVLHLGHDERGTEPIVARVKWSSVVAASESSPSEPPEPEYRIGCEFVNRQGFAECRRRIDDYPEARRLRLGHNPKWLIILLGVTVAAIGAICNWHAIF